MDEAADKDTIAMEIKRPFHVNGRSLMVAAVTNVVSIIAGNCRDRGLAL